jgi:hypothetical protein
MRLRGEMAQKQVSGTDMPGRVHVRLVAGLVLACIAGLANAVPAAAACENEATRTGPSASLPNCRAYELVTPSDKSGTHQDLGRESIQGAVAAVDGNRLGLKTFVTLGPDPELGGSFLVFSRTASGWVLTPVRSAETPGSSLYKSEIFSPDLTQIGVKSETVSPLSPEEPVQVGVPGGPYAILAAPPNEQHILRPEGKTHELGTTRLLGANADFSRIVLGSTDHTLISDTPTGTDEDAYDLYEWVNGKLRLVNVSDTGSLTSECGAVLGYGHVSGGGTPELHHNLIDNAISGDGSKIFFTSPDPLGPGGGEDCADAPSLYMRVTEMAGGREENKTIEMSAPEEVTLSAKEEEMPVVYEGASTNGARVFFITERALTSDATADFFHLYEYDTEATEGRRLKLAFQRQTTTSLLNEAQEVFVVNDGSVVYFYGNRYKELYRYEAAGGGSVHQIASLSGPEYNETPSSTSDGEFFLFASEGVAGEPRGAGHNELYRYDHANGSVMCVSCGPNDAPANVEGFMGNASAGRTSLQFEPLDEVPNFTNMSDDGSEVFFDSTGSLAPQVVNEGVMNVYEWAADGTGSCTNSVGCTYLISEGDSAVDSLLIGASADGSNVFFLTHSQLVPRDRDSLGDIYDARVDGGLPEAEESAACLGDTCLSSPVAAIEPTLGTSVSNGVGNLAITPTPKAKRCGKGMARRKGSCVKKRRARKARRIVKHNHGGSK